MTETTDYRWACAVAPERDWLRVTCGTKHVWIYHESDDSDTDPTKAAVVAMAPTDARALAATLTAMADRIDPPPPRTPGLGQNYDTLMERIAASVGVALMDIVTADRGGLTAWHEATHVVPPWTDGKPDTAGDMVCHELDHWSRPCTRNAGHPGPHDGRGQRVAVDVLPDGTVVAVDPVVRCGARPFGSSPNTPGCTRPAGHQGQHDPACFA